MRKIRASIWACIVVASGVPSYALAESLLRVGQPRAEASLVGISVDGAMQFNVDGYTTKVTLQELRRWSAPRENVDRTELLLTDGSRLVLAEAWAEQDPWLSTDGTQLHVVSSLVGHVELQRTDAHAVLVNGSKDRQKRQRQIDRILGYSKQADLLRLVNGDSWSGRFSGINGGVEGSLRPIQWRLSPTDQLVKIPERRVVSVVLGSEKKVAWQAKLIVGLSDGSLLHAESVVVREGQFQVQLANGVTLDGEDSSDIVYLRSLRADCHYLSDGIPSEYQHRPYLEIESPYLRDRNVLGGPLQVGDQQYEKGLGVSTATQLTYEIDAKLQRRRFIAAVAVDDAATRRGSVVFRVYLRRDGEWTSAYKSAIVRGGDPLVPVSVDLGSAKQIALVTDFADRGDELDYGNWLEARFE